jgi:tripartite ATP-independent transporter DctM subunit
MTPLVLAALAILAMFVLIALHVPIGISMGVVGVVGFGFMSSSFPAGLSLLASEAASNLASMDLVVIPLFILMGNFACAAGISTDIYNIANAFLGHRRGGLAMATIGGCGLFGAVCGSSIATTATFGRVALPEMTKRKYSATLATGCIGGGGTLGTLVPPSIILVIYAVLAEQFIVELFIAAVIPAILTILLYFVAIAVYVRIYPESGPASSRICWRERGKILLKSWAAIFLIAAIAVGIYGGIFTVTEAASLGVVLAFGFALIRRQMNLAAFWEALANTAGTTAMIYMILIGSSIFNYFIVVSHLPDSLANGILGSGWPQAVIFLVLLCVYIVLGSIFDTTAAMVITLPFVLPLIEAMGYSPVWWGIVNVVVVEVGMITPPMGINIFMLQGIIGEKYPLSTIFKGIIPFLCADIVRLALIVLFPILSLWLPRVIGG